MTTRPIIFSADMVRAILGGRKSQTRCAVEPQPPFGCEYAINGDRSHGVCYSDEVVDGAAVPRRVWVPPTPTSTDHRLPCPYGKPGDALWIQETVLPIGKHPDPGIDACGAGVFYRADYFAFEWADLASESETSWRLCKRHESRITLQITGVRVERVHEISEADAIAEGTDGSCSWASGAARCDSKGDLVINQFWALWDSINAKKGYGWDANPYVWVIEFERVNTTPANGGKEEG